MFTQGLMRNQLEKRAIDIYMIFLTHRQACASNRDLQRQQNAKNSLKITVRFHWNKYDEKRQQRYETYVHRDSK